MLLLNIWLIVTLGLCFNLHHAAHITSYTSEARSVAGSLQTNAAKLGISSRAVQVCRHGQTRDCAIYTPA